MSHEKFLCLFKIKSLVDGRKPSSVFLERGKTREGIFRSRITITIKNIHFPSNFSLSTRTITYLINTLDKTKEKEVHLFL